MPTSFDHKGVAEISAAKATETPTVTRNARLLPSVGCQVVIPGFDPDWRAFPTGALTFNPAYG